MDYSFHTLFKGHHIECRADQGCDVVLDAPQIRVPLWQFHETNPSQKALEIRAGLFRILKKSLVRANLLEATIFTHICLGP